MHSQNHTDTLYRSFRQTMAKHGLPRADSHILVAFSGGADSTALLHLTLSLVNAQKSKPRITALHVDHGIRGEEAKRDATFCRQFCESRGVPFVLYEANVPAEAKQRGMTLEEAAREIRYRFITDHLAAHPDITCVLTAHHADDQAETVLFRLLRGTSLRGLGGIPGVRILTVSDDAQPNAVRSVPLIRPLLSFTKAQLCSYLAERGLSFVTDSTNAENDASRNLLRNTLIPMAKQINPAFSDALGRLSGHAEQDEEYFTQQVQLFFESISRSPTDPIPADALLQCHIAVRRRVLAVIYDTHREQHAELKPMTAAFLDTMLHAAETNGKVLLSAGFSFSAVDGICRMEAESLQTTDQKYHIILPPGEITPLPDGSCCLLCDGSVKSSENLRRLKNIYKLFISTHINSDKLLSDIYLRPRCDNKTDVYLCGGSHKTAKDALSAHRVPTHLRKIVPLFCDGDGIVWIPFCGIRDSLNPKTADPGAPIIDLYYFYNSEVSAYASRY